MTVVSTTQNREAMTLTVVAELAAPPARVWQIWADPRQLERWWGPPEFPATFESHDLAPGGMAHYYMTGPNGEKHGGWWRFLAVDEPHSIEFEDGFADGSGPADPESGITRGHVALEPITTGTRMTVTSHFRSIEALDELVKIGMVEGMTQAMGQIDAILAGAGPAS
jgi:uncharacterized protein YndB with AHSA1/START domain